MAGFKSAHPEYILILQLTLEFSGCPNCEILRRKTLKNTRFTAVFFLDFRKKVLRIIIQDLIGGSITQVNRLYSDCREKNYLH